ncbi:MlaD family protein [Rhodococcus erythropolis]|uniref:MlaD family protein n=1 Tax=Rhodococcus erythropolis TaxID=1833 RepID=UPI00210A43B1|nr:MlaD family protein [Rhodococcus erythropolis]MCQ4127665.1 MlaD family protein [Rhodococcus erythropolis]
MNRLNILRLGVMTVAGCILTGCAVNVTDLPIPGNTSPTGSYTVTAEFASVLNLPIKANVQLSGVKVGLVDNVYLSPHGTAIADLAIMPGTELSRRTRAELKQDTLLGETYVQLTSEPDPQPVLKAGDRIDIKDTATVVNVEDTLRGLAQVVTGGDLLRMVDAATELNGALPQNPDETTRLVNRAGTALAELAGATTETDQILEATRRTLDEMIEHRESLNAVLSAGPERLGKVSDVVFDLVGLILSIGYMTEYSSNLLEPIAGELGHVVDTLTPILTAVARSDRTFIDATTLLQRILGEKLGTRLTSPDSRIALHVEGQPASGLQYVLQTLGGPR